MGPVTLQQHSTIDESLAAAWAGLAERLDAPPWLRAGWFEAWFHAFGTGQPHIVVAHRDGAVCGVLPLERRQGVLRSASNYHTPAFEALVDGADALTAITRGVLREPTRRIELRFLPEGGELLRAARASAAEAGRRTLVRVVERSPVVDTSEDWAAYEAGRRPGLRQELRRRRRRLEEVGKLELVVEDGQERLEELLDEGMRVEQSGWKGERGTAIGSAAATRAFYQAVGAEAARAGALRLGFLRLDGRAIAFDFAMEHRGVHYLLKTGYLDELRRYGPGMLLREGMLRRAFELGLARYEFLGHDDPWKMEWATERTSQVLLQSMSGPLGLLEWAAFRYGRPLVRRLLRPAG